MRGAQTPGEFVVFPVRVARRGVAASRVVSLDSEELSGARRNSETRRAASTRRRA